MFVVLLLANVLFLTNSAMAQNGGLELGNYSEWDITSGTTTPGTRFVPDATLDGSQFSLPTNANTSASGSSVVDSGARSIRVGDSI